MPQVYAVEYTTNGTTYTALSNVQSVNVKIGREALIDNYASLSGRVVMRYPTGYANPVAALVTGTRLRVSNSTTGKIICYGVIADVVVSYGMPYTAGVGNADYVEISFEGALAKWARTGGSSYAMGAGTATAQLSTAATQSGLAQTNTYSGTDNPTVAATTVTTTWGDWLNKFTATLNGRIREGDNQIVALSKYTVATSTINFSDTANNATNQVYNAITFDSLGQNFFTQVSVTPESYAVQTVQTGSSPYRTLQLATFNSSTTQAADLANYLLNIYNTAKFALSSVSCLAEAQNSMKLDAIGTGFWDCIGYTVGVTFRGTTFYGVIEGAAMTATPNEAVYTFYLSGADLNSYLILNNPALGKLNSNKLGY
jgi:hypothetical protein